MVIVVSILFFFFPILSVPFLLLGIFLDKNIGHKKIYVALLVVAVALLLYYFLPDESKDLYRYYKIMNRLSETSLESFLGSLANGVEPISKLYFYFFSQLGNHNLIMIATTFISYGIIFYILFDYRKKAQTSSMDFAMVIAFVFSTFYLIDDISGIRFCLARLVFFLALYLDIIKGKKAIYTIPLYIASPLIHSSCIIFLIIRFVLKIVRGRFNIPVFTGIAIFALSSNLIISLADQLSNMPFLSTLSSKAEEYLALNASYYPMFVMQIAVAVTMVLMLLFAKKHNLSNVKYINFILMIMTIGLLMTNCTSISTRFLRAGIVFSYPVIMDFLKTLKAKDKIWVYSIGLVICAISIVFQVSHLTVKCSFGDLFDDGLLKNTIMLVLKG